MIRAAIVGIGTWGRTLVAAVQGRSEAIRFTAGHNRTRAVAEAFCAEHGIALADDLDALLADPQLDAVVFATPHSQHAAQVERAAAAGKHVFIEKPFTLDLASAEAALAAAARAGIVLGIGYPRRFQPAIAELRARIEDGRLGAIGHCSAEQTAPAALTMRPDYWRADPQEAPAGAMTAVGVHNVDLLIHLFGAVDEVYCRNLHRADGPADDTTSILFGFRNGMSGSLFASIATTVTNRLAVFGSGGAVEIAGRGFDFRFTPLPGAPAPETGPELRQWPGFDALKAELEAFAMAIETGTPFPIPPAEIAHGVAVLDAIVRSAADNRPVAITHNF